MVETLRILPGYKQGHFSGRETRIFFITMRTSHRSYSSVMIWQEDHTHKLVDCVRLSCRISKAFIYPAVTLF